MKLIIEIYKDKKFLWDVMLGKHNNLENGSDLQANLWTTVIFVAVVILQMYLIIKE